MVEMEKSVFGCWKDSPSANRGFEVLAVGEMCFEGMGAVEKGV